MTHGPTRPLLPVICALSVLSCAKEPAYGGALEAPGGAAGDGGDSAVDIEVPAPSLGAEEVVATVEAALAVGIPEAFSPRDEYVRFFDEHAEAGACPDSELPYHLPGTYEACTTDDGTTFFGHGEYQEEVEDDAVTSFYLLGDFWILDDQGRRYDGAGEALYGMRPDGEDPDTTVTADLIFTGTWGYPGAEGWLSESVSMALFSFGSWTSGSWVGGFQGSVDLHGTSLFMEDLSFDGRYCTDAPVMGRLRLRDHPTGYWYTLSFPQQCSPCGELTWADGSSMGEVCVDFGTSVSDYFEGLLTADGTVDPQGAGW